MLNGIMCCDKSGKVRLEMCIKKVNSMVFDVLMTFLKAVFSTQCSFPRSLFQYIWTPTSLKANLGYCDRLDNLTYILGC